MLLDPFPQPPIIRVKYPVVLMHGFGVIAAFGRKGHLHGEAMHLRSCGIQAFAPNVAPYDTIAERARAWQRRLKTVLEQTDASHVHLIAHSMGGLDARHLISKLGGHTYVKTLTTITSPHRGTSIATIALEQPQLIQQWTARLVNILGEAVLEDASANFLSVLKELDPDYVKETFNPDTPNHKDVRYCSYAGLAGKGTGVTINPFLIPLNRLIYEREGPNDGFVTPESATWGTLLGTVYADHTAQIGLRIPPASAFDSHEFYRGIVQQLA